MGLLNDEEKFHIRWKGIAVKIILADAEDRLATIQFKSGRIRSASYDELSSEHGQAVLDFTLRNAAKKTKAFLKRES
jgi:hypothetical protein